MNKEVQQKNLGWSHIEYQVDKICNHITYKFDVVVGISRGGLIPAVMISHRLKLPLLTMSVTLRDNLARVQSLKINRGERALVVDDINDSGNTLNMISEFFKTRHIHASYAVLQNKLSSNFSVDYWGSLQDNDDWINFPWENK
jgi:xanthine phosphoribosyltransferase